MKAAREADLIIYVVDRSRPADENDREIIRFIRVRSRWEWKRGCDQGRKAKRFPTGGPLCC